MRKIIKKYGSSLIITFSAEERKVFKIKEGDLFEVDDHAISITKQKKK